MSAAVDTLEKPSVPGVNPWLGLASYTEADSTRFFGRDDDTTQLVNLIQRDTLTILFGRSGLGKTSLLRAGVVPRLRDSGYFPVFIRIDHSSHAPHPIEQAEAFARQAAAAGGVSLEWPKVPSEKATLWEFFRGLEAWGPRNDLLTLLLVFDQFEEAFTIGRSSSRTHEYLEQLADLAEDRVPRSVRERAVQNAERLATTGGSARYKVLLSLREDYVAQLDSLSGMMPAILRNRLALQPLDAAAAIAVVARAGKQTVDPDVAEAIVVAVQGAQPSLESGEGSGSHHGEIEPAYLSVMCHELFERMIATGATSITRTLVAEEHGRILDSLYERSFLGLDPRVRIFVEEHLVTPSGFRSTLPVEDALGMGIANEDLEVLVNRRLLRFEDRLGTRHIELSHDLLTAIVLTCRNERHLSELRTSEVREIARQATRLRRSRIQTAVVASILALGVGAFCLEKLAYTWETSAHYTDWTTRWGKVEGIGPRIGAEDLRHREHSWRITRRGWLGPVIRLERVDSKGRPQGSGSATLFTNSGTNDEPDENHSTYSREYSYDDNGQLVHEVARDRFGRMIAGVEYFYPPPSSKGRPEKVVVTNVGPAGFPLPSGKQAEYAENTYDKNSGFTLEERFLDAAGHPAPGADDAFGERYTYDAQGRRTRVESFDRDGHTMVDGSGNAVVAYSRKLDARGRVTEQDARFLDQAGQPIEVDNYARRVTTYDSWGNEVEDRFFDAAGSPVRAASSYAHRIINAYEDGENVARWFYGPDGAPSRVKGVPYDTGLRTGFDRDTGLVESYTYYEGDRDDWRHPLSPVYACANYHQTYEEPKSGIRKDASLRFVRSGEWFDDHGAPCKTRGWIHQIRYINDDFGEVRSKTAYDTDGAPTVFPDIHCATVNYVRDDRGRVLEESYSTKESAPCVNPETGVYSTHYEYDRIGNVIGTEYWKPGHNAVVSKTEHFHRKEASFGAFGVTELKYFGAWGQKIEVDGRHRATYAYDPDNGLLTSEQSFAVDGSRTTETEYEYDAHRKQIHRHRFDGKGLSTEELRFVYDSRGLQSEERVVPPPDSDTVVARYLYDYDDRNRNTGEKAFGRKDQLLWSKAWSYDPVNDHEIDELHFGPDGGKANFDNDGSPTSKDGIARIHYEYDSWGRRTVLEYLDKDDKPAADNEGIHEEIVGYEGAGKIVTQLGKHGEPMWIRDLNIATHRVVTGEESFQDEHGGLVLGPTGYAKMISSTFADGHVDDQIYDSSGHLFLDPVLGYARHVQEPIGGGNWVAKYFDASGNLIAPFGFAEERFEENALGQIVEDAYFDEHGRPTYGFGGHHRKLTVYTDSGEQLSSSFYDVDGSVLKVNTEADRVALWYVDNFLQTSLAARVGLQRGDVLWRFGTWSFVDALKAARKVDHEGDVSHKVFDAWSAVRDQARWATIPLTVVRLGKAVTLQVGPLGTGAKLGAEMQTRLLPTSAFEAFAREHP
jgi:hypothetical protein